MLDRFWRHHELNTLPRIKTLTTKTQRHEVFRNLPLWLRDLVVFRRRSYAVAFCLLILVLAGCGKLLPTPDPVTIKFPHMENDTAYYELLAQQFHEQNPYITVELVKMPRPSFTRKLNAAPGRGGRP